MPELTRRTFLKLSAAGTGAAGLTALGFDTASAVQVTQNFRIAGARESHSVCPYCAVGCALVAYTRDNADGSRQLLQIEGNPDSPVNEGRLCPKGATAMQLATSARRVESPMYRAPGSDHPLARHQEHRLDVDQRRQPGGSPSGRLSVVPPG